MLFSLTVSCEQKFKTQDDLLNFISEEDNGYKYSKEVNGVKYILSYKPTDLLVIQEINNKATTAEKDSLRKKYSSYMYFNLTMSRNNTELLNIVARDKDQFGSLVNNLAFNMDAKLHLYTPEKDTIEMADFIYPRMFGYSKSTDVLIVYPRTNKIIAAKQLYLTVEDLGFQTGEVKFKLDNTILQKEPQLSAN